MEKTIDGAPAMGRPAETIEYYVRFVGTKIRADAKFLFCLACSSREE